MGYTEKEPFRDRTDCYERSMDENDTAGALPLKSYIRLLSFILKKQSLLFILYIALAVVSGLLTPFAIARWKIYIDQAEAVREMSGLAVSVVGALGIFILLKSVQSIFQTAMENVSARFNFASWFSMDKEINIKAMELEPEFFEIPKTQAMIDRAWYFTRAGFVLLFQLGLRIFSSISAVAGLFVSMYILDKKICFVSILAIVPAVFNRFVSDREAFENNQKTSLEMLEYNYFKNIFMDKQLYREIKLNDKFGFFTKKFEDKSKTILAMRQKSHKRKAVFLFAGSFSRNVILVLCLLLAARQMIYGGVTMGGFAAIFMLITELINAMTETAGHVTSIITSSYSINVFFQFLDLQKEKGEAEMYLEPAAANGQNGLEFDHVSFRYPLSEEAFMKDITIRIKPGEHVAVVGANGSGKSTFIKLLAGMLEPSRGQIRLDGQDIREIPAQCYYDHFSAVFQDYNKYKESLGYNVFISDIQKKDQADAVKEALDFVGFHKDIPLDTILSTEFGGIDLSGGEWQRIAIARAFFGRKDILILDVN